MLSNRIKHFTLALYIIPTLAYAQGATGMKLQKQHNMVKWGIPAANYSGIAKLSPDNKAGLPTPFAIVDDKDKIHAFRIVEITQDKKTGDIMKISQSSLSHHSTTILDEDAEGIAWVRDTNTLYISYEGSQRIREYSLDGKLTGKELNVPQQFDRQSIYPNYGFEALTYDATHGLFWTTTEHSLPSDSQETGKNSTNVPCTLRLQSFNRDGQPLRQYFYMTEKPKAKRISRNYAFGVSALTALEDGSILVLEREFYVARHYIGSWVNHNIFRIVPCGQEGEYLKKELVASFRTRLNLTSRNLANYEGMCLGAKLDDNKQTVLLISDSQKGFGNSLYRMKDYIRVLTISLSDNEAV